MNGTTDIIFVQSVLLKNVLRKLKMDKKTSKAIDEKIDDFIKLKQCCDWNGYSFKKVPAYKSLKEELFAILGENVK
jgi:hypothetical protein